MNDSAVLRLLSPDYLSRVAVFYFSGETTDVRCLELAQSLNDAGWRCEFVKQSKKAPDLVQLRQSFPNGCDLFVIDDPSVTALFETSCGSWSKSFLRINGGKDSCAKYQGARQTTLSLLGSLPARDGKHVTLRMAEIEDARQMFHWQIDDRSRRYARNSQKPSWEEHLAWVEKVRKDPTRRLCIIEHANNAAGILRLDQVNSSAGYEVSVVTDPKMYRQGVGLPALFLARAWVPRVPLLAQVLDQNQASLTMVLAAGFVEVSPGHFSTQPLLKSYPNGK